MKNLPSSKYAHDRGLPELLAWCLSSIGLLLQRDLQIPDDPSAANDEMFFSFVRDCYKTQTNPVSIAVGGRAIPYFSQLDCSVYSDLHYCSRQYSLRGQDAEAIL